MPEDPYTYPGTIVLRNRFDLRDADQLARVEAIFTSVRLAELNTTPLSGGYDLAHLQAFHQRIFGDVYPWAGEIRAVTITKSGGMFALPHHIRPYLRDVLTQLAREDHLRWLAGSELTNRLAHYLAEINSTHPFRDGNGRTQRAFIGQLAQGAGHTIDWQHLDLQRNIDASRAAHHGNNEPLRRLLADLTRPTR